MRVHSIPRLGRSPGGGHGNSLQYSCLENPMDRGAWRATIHRVAKSQTRVKQFGTHARTHGGRERISQERAYVVGAGDTTDP